MSKNFHESYGGQGDVKPPSERATGLTFAVVSVIVAVLWRNSPTVAQAALGIGAVFAALAMLAPVLLKPVNTAWFKLGLLLHRVVNPVVMFLIFAVVFVPAGFLMRFWHDPLRSRRAPAGASYWIERTKPAEGQAGSMSNQF